MMEFATRQATKSKVETVILLQSERVKMDFRDDRHNIIIWCIVSIVVSNHRQKKVKI